MTIYRYLIALIIAFVVAASGCNRDSNKRESESTSDTSIASISQTLTDVNEPTDASPPQRPASIHTTRKVDPDSETSSTEALTERIDKQLKILANMMIGEKSPTSTDHLFSQDFATEFATQDELRPIFSDQDFFVSRLDPDCLKMSGNSTRFLEFLSRELNANSRIKFKVYRIEELANIVKTLIRLRMGVKTEANAIQQTIILQCEWSKEERPRLRHALIEDFERVVLTDRTSTFEDCTEAILAKNESYQQQLVYGLDYWLDRLELYQGIVATSYHGISVADVNGDGLDDIYTCQPGGIMGGLPNRLYLQNEDGTATDYSRESGLDWLTETHCALFVDFDNDGDQDMVGSTMAGLIFAENDGSGKFALKVFKLVAESPPISLAAADFDNDGDIDLYACCYGRRASAEIMGRPLPYHDANNGSRNVLFRNDQYWRFKNVTKMMGMEQNNHRFSLACAWEDFDNDGDQDLYVANDFGRNNLYRNDGERFVDVAAKQNVEDMSAGMSVAWGDYDNNGRMDLYVSNMWSSAGNRITYQKDFLNGKKDATTRSKFQRHARGNSLFSNADGRFLDVSNESRTSMADWAWSSKFADLNNDGFEDLVVANGYITQENTKDL